MKSVIGTIVVFIGLYILVVGNVFDFLSQDFIFPIVLGVIVALLVVAVLVLGIPKLSKKGEDHDKDTNLN